MAVVVEDGTIVSGANSFASVADADTYHGDMGNTTWSGFTTAVKEAGLIRGTQMIESRYRGRWIGYKTNNNQGVVQLLAWPRKSNNTQPTQDDTTVDDDPQALTDENNVVIGVNSVPVRVQHACMEAAYMHASGSPLIPNSIGRDKYIKRNKVDVIEQEFFSSAPAVDRFPLIDQLLQGLASVGGVNLSMVIGISENERLSIEGEDPTQAWLDSLGGA